jgi:hypothetical protein
MKIRKFAGTLEELKAIVGAMRVEGAWEASRNPDNGVRFRAEGGSVLNFWPSTGSISIQGADQDAFRDAFLEARATTAEQRVGILSERFRRLREKLKSRR